jgi:hypothetical protein
MILFRLVNKFPVFHGNWRFVSVFTKVLNLIFPFTKALHLPLSWAELIHFKPYHSAFFKTLIVYCYYCQPFPSGRFLEYVWKNIHKYYDIFMWNIMFIIILPRFYVVWQETGFGFVIGFIQSLHILIISNYSTLASSYTQQLSTAHTKSSQSVMFSPVVVW